MWPPEIKKDLRSGLLAKRKGDLDLAESYLSRCAESPPHFRVLKAHLNGSLYQSLG